MSASVIFFLELFSSELLAEVLNFLDEHAFEVVDRVGSILAGHVVVGAGCEKWLNDRL